MRYRLCKTEKKWLVNVYRLAMIHYIVSSFSFLIPIYLSYLYRDIVGLFLFSIGMGISIAHYSHLFHRDEMSRGMFKLMNLLYMDVLAVYLIVDAIYRISYWKIMVIVVLNCYLYEKLGIQSIEQYSKKDQLQYIVFHIMGVCSFCYLRFF